MKIKIEVT